MRKGWCISCPTCGIRVWASRFKWLAAVQLWTLKRAYPGVCAQGGYEDMVVVYNPGRRRDD